MKVTVTFDLLGDNKTVTHSAPHVTYRLQDSGVATVREYDTDGTEVRSTSYRSAWIITRTKEETP